MKLCSACLLGINCKYDGTNNMNEKVLALAKKEILIPVCPEQLGGLKTPRIGSGIIDGEGKEVIQKKAKVINRNNKDMTENFLKGAEETLKIAKTLNIKEAILKQGSPSCGCGLFFQWKEIDGKLHNKKAKGDGVTTALLKKNGIKVITEEEI